MNWKSIKLLNELFEKGETSKEIMDIPLAKRMLEMEYIVYSNKSRVFKTNLFDGYYSGTLLRNYKQFQDLISKYSLQDTNFNETDLIALVKIELNKGAILLDSQSMKEISTLYFDDAKYLKRGTKLYEAVLKILDVETLPIDEHDQQYLHVLHCKNKIPKIVVLCENDNQLRKPRLDDIELWFAGGRNTAKLKFVPEPKVSFYYLCDWDNRGIEIYQDIKKNLFPSIQLLIPEEPIKLSKVKSDWKTKIDYSLFSIEAVELLEKLIPEYWIEEESIKHKLLVR
ncbi:hypothetical protein [Flavisolibacter nicotianae]|uniref:hypothetical protein n=1 Tax=Flavisolibacter nicotianae TaxID=2364882 RepID=UPI000EAD4AF5|nr:hypothetical protein [Flavisolibacter nicotianae]